MRSNRQPSALRCLPRRRPTADIVPLVTFSFILVQFLAHSHTRGSGHRYCRPLHTSCGRLIPGTILAELFRGRALQRESALKKQHTKSNCTDLTVSQVNMPSTLAFRRVRC